MFNFIIKIWAFIVSIIPHFSVVLDTETTGFPGDGEILQLSLISASGRILFNKYIKPDNATEWKEAQKINHISPRMVKHCKSFSAYKPLIKAFLRHTKRIIGFNHKRFDLPILEEYGILTNSDEIDLMQDDAKKRTKPGEREARWRKLKVVARSYGYFFYPHDSLSDCLATAHIYAFMHPGFHSVVYIFRKIVQIGVGAILLKLLSSYIIPGPFELEHGLTYLIIAAWSFVYGPIVATLSTFIGSCFLSTGLHPVSLTIFAICLSMLYSYIKTPKPLVAKVLLTIVASIVVGIIVFFLLPILSSELPFANPSLDELINIIVIMVCGTPLYFILNRILRRIL